MFVHYFTGTVSVCVIPKSDDLWLRSILRVVRTTKWIQLPVDMKSFVLVKNVLDIFSL